MKKYYSDLNLPIVLILRFIYFEIKCIPVFNAPMFTHSRLLIILLLLLTLFFYFPPFFLHFYSFFFTFHYFFYNHFFIVSCLFNLIIFLVYSFLFIGFSLYHFHLTYFRWIWNISSISPESCFLNDVIHNKIMNLI